MTGLYGMYSGGMAPCSGTTRAGRRCRRSGYVVNRQYAFYCRQHEGQADRG